MKKLKDKFKQNIIKNKKTLVFLVTIAVIAIIFGSLFSVILNEGDKTLVNEYIHNFFENIKNNNLNYLSALKNGSINMISYILIVWLLGISVIGLPIIIFMYFSKLFVLGFSVSSIISNYGFKGCLISFSYIFPHHIIYIIVYTLLTVYSIKMSIKLLFSILKKDKLDFKPIINKYLVILIVSVLFSLIALLFEVFVTPKFINLFLPILK